jgi:high-affinity nickel-transport protein
VLAGGAAGAGLPWYAILSLPILFAAGMSLLDSIDGSFMNFAYGWLFSTPVRKAFYNITITGLSVAIAVVIGTIELGGLLASELNLPGSFWNWYENIDMNFLGLVIVGMFVVTWAIALSVWRYGRIEERWGASVK